MATKGRKTASRRQAEAKQIDVMAMVKARLKAAARVASKAAKPPVDRASGEARSILMQVEKRLSATVGRHKPKKAAKTAAKKAAKKASKRKSAVTAHYKAGPRDPDDFVDEFGGYKVKLRR